MEYLVSRGRHARLKERRVRKTLALDVERDERRRGPRLCEYEVVVPGLDPAHDGLRVAHLTDLHVGMLTPDRKILRAIEHAEEAKPDLVLLTGDFVCYSPRFVGKLREIVR